MKRENAVIILKIRFLWRMNAAYLVFLDAWCTLRSTSTLSLLYCYYHILWDRECSGLVDSIEFERCFELKGVCSWPLLAACRDRVGSQLNLSSPTLAVNLSLDSKRLRTNFANLNPFLPSEPQGAQTCTHNAKQIVSRSEDLTVVLMKFKICGMIRHVDLSIITRVVKEHNAFVYSVKRSNKSPWRWRRRRRRSCNISVTIFARLGGVSQNIWVCANWKDSIFFALLSFAAVIFHSILPLQRLSSGEK